MSGVVNADSSSESFVYSGAGQRRRKTTNAGEVVYLWDEENVLAEFNAGGGLIAQYTDHPGYWGGLTSLHLEGGSSAFIAPIGGMGAFNTVEFNQWGFNQVQPSGGSGDYYYLFDQSANTRYLVDGSEEVTDSELCRAFGERVAGTGNTRNPYRFQGEVGPYTDATNRVWMRARSYDPVTGGWYSSDPIGFDGGDWNLYRFIENNPANWIDPTGFERGRATLGGVELTEHNPTQSNPTYLLKPGQEEKDLLYGTLNTVRSCMNKFPNVRWYIAQGIGHDRESFKVHYADGKCHLAQGPYRKESDRQGQYYSAAVDLSIQGLTYIGSPYKKGWNERELTKTEKTQFCAMVQCLRKAGLVAWHRYRGQTAGTSENEIHLIDPMAPCMKDQLAKQVRSYIAGGTGGGYPKRDSCAGIKGSNGRDMGDFQVAALRARAKKRSKLQKCCTTPNGNDCPTPDFK